MVRDKIREIFITELRVLGSPSLHPFVRSLHSTVEFQGVDHSPCRPKVGSVTPDPAPNRRQERRTSTTASPAEQDVHFPVPRVH